MDLSARRTLSNPSSDLRIDWPLSVRLARIGASKGVKAWFAESEVRGGRVDGSVGRLTPGSVRSNGFFRQSMWTTMVSGGVHEIVAAGFSDAVWKSWKAWFDHYETTLEYPALAHVESAFASPVANKPLLLIKGKSLADDRLGSEQLAAMIEHSLLSFASAPGAHEACLGFADWFNDCFARWRPIVLLMNIMASGPVPSYSPPKVTSGPVAGGTLVSLRPMFSDLGKFDVPG